MKNMYDSWEGQKTNMNRSLERRWFQSSWVTLNKTSVEKVTTDLGEIATELELEEEPEDVVELLPSHDKDLIDKVLLLMDGQ